MGKRWGTYGRAFEDKVCEKLTEMLSGLKKPVQPFKRSGEVKIPYTLPEALYSPDIVIKDTLFVEVKSYLDRDDQLKMRAVKKSNPDLDIRFVFLKADKIVAGSKMTHAKWAQKYGFPYAEGEIPSEWLL